MTDQPALILVDVQQAFREEDFFGGGRNNPHSPLLDVLTP